MSSRNRDKQSRESRVGTSAGLVPSLPRSSRPTWLLVLTRQRRGVLLLVVLSLLVLFMLLGTAFLMSSSQYKSRRCGVGEEGSTRQISDEASGRRCDAGSARYGQPVFGRPLPQPTARYVRRRRIRSQKSTARLRRCVRRRPSPRSKSRDSQARRPDTAQQLGPTQGQLIDIYVRQLAFNSAVTSANDRVPTTR